MVNYNNVQKLRGASRGFGKTMKRGLVEVGRTVVAGMRARPPDSQSSKKYGTRRRY